MLRIAHKITRHQKKIREIFADPEKSASAASLVYVNDSMPGITRVRRNGKFIYLHNGRLVRSPKVLFRIRALVLPPAWEQVWICPLDNGHLQATGKDKLGRKQYRYHNLWSAHRNETKFHRLQELGKVIPVLRSKLEQDLTLKGLQQKKVLALVVSLIERTSIRVGNTLYEKLYGSFGLTTLKDQHVKIKGSTLHFIFKGKKGVVQNVLITSKRLANLVKKCRDIPGKELFQYIDEEGNARCIDSGMVNDYLKEITGQEFTAKDLRTWRGTVQALAEFKNLTTGHEENSSKKNIQLVLDNVARHLGNTRAVCRKYYVHPALIELYECGRLKRYLAEMDKPLKAGQFDLVCEEKILLKILNRESLRMSA